MNQKKPSLRPGAEQIVHFIDERAPFPIGSLFLLLISAVFLLNLSSGGIIPIEIPDILPVVGNLDEAAATALLISSIRNLSQWRKLKQAQQSARSEVKEES